MDGPLSLELAQLAWHDIGFRLGPWVAHVDHIVAKGVRASMPRSVQVQELQITGAALRAASRLPRPPALDGWRLDPVAQMSGTLHAFVTEAAWIVDADVTVPIAQGRIDFNRVSVSHIGPDSSMGMSHLGIYVDAPNGRTYLYQFATPHVPGARFERRGALFGAFVTDRGELALQDFLECALRHACNGGALGSAPHDVGRKLDRTRFVGELQPGDGALAAGPLKLTLAGRAERRNALQLSAAALGHTLTVRLPALLARELSAALFGATMHAEELSGSLSLALGRDNVTLDVAELTLRQLSLEGDANADLMGLHSATAGVQ